VARVLTDEQRAAKRVADANYRARKAAQKNQTPRVEQYSVQFSAEMEDAVQGLLNGKISKEDFAEVAKAPEAISFEEISLEEMRAHGAEDKVDPLTLDKVKALMGLLGDTVKAPITQLNAVVAKTFRGGGRLLTEDGEFMWANVCGHSTEERESRGTVLFFEQVGEGNKDFADGTTGLIHRFSRCNKVVFKA